MKILITGGSGFIGSFLLLTLQKKYEITVLDRGSTYPELKKIIPKNINLVKGDVNDEFLLNKLVKDSDIVIHLVGRGGSDVCLEDPVEAFKINTESTTNIVRAAKKYDIDKLIFISSYIAYSTFKKRSMPLKEDAELMPDEFYGILKANSEKQISLFKNNIILRLSTVYGYGTGLGRIQWQGVVGKFIKSAMENSTIPVYGSGKQKIDLIHVNDVCDAIAILIEKDIKDEKFNIGSGNPVSILEIAKTVSKIFKEKFNKEIKIDYLEPPKDKLWPDRYTSIEKIKNLGWKPKVTLEKGILEIIENENINPSD